MAQRLSDVPGCLVPQVRRYTRAGLSALGFDPRRTSLNFPILARPTGTHGGEQFEMVNCPIELEALVKQNHAAEFYLSHFVDYRSGDGYFRKFRFFFIGGDIFPYHLAIDDQWKVHHATTDMGRHRWMQEEEKHFLEDPHAVFGPRALAALDAIQRAVGLEYFGIDCALDAKGNVLVFEVNACMLAHGNNEAFAYKTEAVLRIKRAFHALLARKASPHQPLPACPQIPGQPSVPRASSKSSS
jgi:hypothetical protein